MSPLELTTTGSREDQQLIELVDEITACLQSGRQLDIDDYLTRYPEYADRLQSWLQAMTAMADLGNSLALHKDADDSASTATDADGQVTGLLGDFRILGELGRGGMGVVYEAEQISIGRRVALKVLPFAAMLDKQQLNRFKNEARAAGTLDHPNIVSVFSVGTERGVHYYAMQLIEGQSLAEVIAALRIADCGSRIEEEEANAAPGSQSEIPNPKSQIETKRDVQAAISTIPKFDTHEYFRSVAQLGIQAAQALDHAHQNGIVHRDVKPSNLLVDANGKLWVTDFGLARIEADAGMTMTGDLLGTLRYMSPEQALAKRAMIDHRTDIYSLGATLYELLTLKPVFTGEDRQELLNQIALEEPRPPRRFNPALPADLETIVLKAMEKNPADRYTTSQELADDLQRMLKDEAIHAKPPTVRKRLAKWSGRHRPLVATAVAVAIAAVLLGGAVAWSQSQQRLKVERMVGESLASARAFLQSKEYESAQQRLAEAQTRLEESGELGGHQHAEVAKLSNEVKQKLEAQRHYTKFHQTRRRALNLYRGHEPEEKKLFQEALTHYQVLDGVKIENLPNFQNLDSLSQTRLREEIAEMLFLLAMSELRQTYDRDAELASNRRAIDLLSRIETVLQPTRSALIHISRCWRILGKEELAAKAEERAHEISPSTSIDYYMMAFTKGQSILQRLDNFSRALDLRPDHYASFTRAGWYHLHLNQYAAAEAMATGAISIYPDFSNNYPLRALARLGQRKFDLAEHDFAKRAELTGGAPDGYYATYLMSRGNHAEALAIFDKSLVKRPHSWVRLRRADLYQTLGNHQKAIQDLSVLIDQVQSELEMRRDRVRHPVALMHVDRAFVYADSGKPDLAREDIANAMSLDTSTAGSRSTLAWFFATSPDRALRDAEQALALAQEVIEQTKKSGLLTTPKGAEYWLTLGAAQYRMDDWDAAIAAFDRARQLDRYELDVPVYAYFLAMTHWQLGHQEQAHQWYDRAARAKNWRMNDWAGRYTSDWQIAHFRKEAADLLGIETDEENAEDVTTDTQTEN